jgi:hypothetical protein
MVITDPQLKAHVERVVSLMTSLPAELRPACGLMDACDWFTHIEGEQSPRSKEALKLILSDDMRPALRPWYQRAGDNMNPAALEFRERLSTLAREKFG